MVPCYFYFIVSWAYKHFTDFLMNQDHDGESFDSPVSVIGLSDSGSDTDTNNGVETDC